jgi:hypothetical protein
MKYAYHTIQVTEFEFVFQAGELLFVLLLKCYRSDQVGLCIYFPFTRGQLAALRIVTEPYQALSALK